ncbi:MAG TPA: gas vesicle protein K [Calidithermus sp.]|nr:gas vesicle protein K [Calidithermus sp.]
MRRRRRRARRSAPRVTDPSAARPAPGSRTRSRTARRRRPASRGRPRLARVTASRRPAGPARWNANPEEVQRAVARLVLTLVEFLRRLFERQALRRMEARTLTPAQVEALGLALMRLEKAVRDLARRFDLRPEDLNLDLGPLGRLT